MNSNDTIQIDAACMGQEWRGTSADLREFAGLLAEMSGREIVAVAHFSALLAKMSGREIVAITDSHNGAAATDPKNDLPEAIWLAAIERHAAENPGAWNL